MAIDVGSGDYEIGEEVIGASRRLRERHPEGRFYLLRIGYNAVYTIGPWLTLGTFHVTCSVHQMMNLTVVVVP